MSFYLPASERQQMQMNAVNAVDQAISYLDNNPKNTEQTKT
jgi:hypothetical protein